MSITSTGLSGFSESGPPADWDWSVGSVIGYRWWFWHVPPKLAGWLSTGEDNAKKFSYLVGAFSGEWEPGKREATCKANTSYSHAIEHEPPEYRESCGCGFWGYWSKHLPMTDVLSKGSMNLVTRAPLFGGEVSTVVLPVFGVIRGSGRVIIGEKGFRSQYAELIGAAFTSETVECLNKWHWREASPAAREMGQFEAALRDGVVFTGREYNGGSQEATSNEVQNRLSVVQLVLQDIYPEAKVFTSRENLVKYFGEDKLYGAGSAFQLDNQYGPDWKQL